MGDDDIVDDGLDPVKKDPELEGEEDEEEDDLVSPDEEPLL